MSGDTRRAARGDDRGVVELDSGVTVYPGRERGDRWRAVWYENGRRRQCQAVSEDRLAAKLEKVTVRLAGDAPNMERPGADLIAYFLSPGRHPAGKQWSRKHTDTQRRLCHRYLAPVIGHVACEDIKAGHLQEAVNAAPTAGEGDRGPPVHLRPRLGRHRRRVPGQPEAETSALAARRRSAHTRTRSDRRWRIGVVRGPVGDPRQR